MQKTQDISNVVKKYVQGDCNEQELDYAISLFEEPYQNIEIRPQLFKIWNKEDFDVHRIPSKEKFNNVLNEVHHRINLKKKEEKVSRVKRLAINLSKIAAVLIIGVLVGLAITKLNKDEVLYYTSVAPKGSVSQMVLPDNTMVYLNAGSQLKYLVNSEQTREVFLEGEAWFDVAKDTRKKFVVHTPYYDVNVMGTEFNVKAYPEDNIVTTTLEDGSVQITSTEKFKLQSSQVLKPGEQLIYDKAKNSIELKNVDVSLYSSWKDNKLIFINMKLDELVVLIERRYGVDIEVKDESILNFHYDGTIKNETVLEMMEILQHTLPIHFEIENQKIIITKKISNSN